MFWCLDVGHDFPSMGLAFRGLGGGAGRHGETGGFGDGRSHCFDAGMDIGMMSDGGEQSVASVVHLLLLSFGGRDGRCRSASFRRRLRSELCRRRPIPGLVLQLAFLRQLLINKLMKE